MHPNWRLATRCRHYLYCPHITRVWDLHTNRNELHRAASRNGYGDRPASPHARLDVAIDDAARVLTRAVIVKSRRYVSTRNYGIYGFKRDAVGLV